MSIKKLLTIGFFAIALSLVSNFFIDQVRSASTILFPYFGGTGTSSTPSLGDLLIGNSSGTYDLISSSSLPFVATETDPIWTASSSSYLTTTTA